MSLSTTGDTSADPRARRLAKLRDQKIFDLTEEKFIQLNILPGTSYDLYNRLLRAQPSTIRQIGMPLEQENRDVEVMTDDIIMVDREMQFCHGDDTGLLNVMKSIAQRKAAKKAGIESSSNTNQSMSSLTATNSNTRLSSFLQQASQVCVALLEEKRIRKEDLNSTSKIKSESIFLPDDKWVIAGQDPDGANEFIRTRKVSSVRFSLLQPHVLITAHPFGDDPEDLKPFMVINISYG